MMDPATATLTLAFIELAMKYGVPAVVSGIQAWQKDPATITVEDIRALGAALPDPETFFKKEV